MTQVKNKQFATDVTIIPSNNNLQISRWEQIFSMFINKFQCQKRTIAVLSLHGIVGKASSYKSGLSIAGINELIEKAFSLPKIRAVVLSVNSPGGSPVQSELIAKRIIALSKKNKIPVLTFVEDVAASGGYWLACAGERIYASKSSVIGSIGVISSGFGFQEAIAKLGIERRVYSQGDNKSVLDPFLPVKTSDVEIITTLQKKIHQHFIDYVKERRGGKLTQNDEFLFNGEFWTGESAVDFGLIDEIGDMYSVLYEKFGDDIDIEYITPKQSWLKKKLEFATRSICNNFADSISDSLIQKIKSNKFDWF